MDKYKNIAKDKWAEKKPSHNIRGSVKNRVNTKLGRNTNSASTTPQEASRPLSDLRDPSSFAPPPRRTGSGLAPPPPPSSAKRAVVAAPSKYQDPRGPPVQPPPKVSTDPELLESYQQSGTVAALPAPQYQEEGERPPPQPYRTDTTGLRTDQFAPPPGRRAGADGRSPPPYDVAVSSPSRAIKAPAPSLPPRLPPRTGSGSSASTQGGASRDNTGGGALNQGAVNRLGAAGVSVPGFGIGASTSPRSGSPAAPPPPPRTGSGGNSQLNELQNRFSRMNTSSSPGNTAPTAPPSQGTTWQQKQAALKTASSFKQDPSSVSFSDAKSAASTANNFRQRHGEQVAAGMQRANNMNQKYDITNRLGAYAGQQSQHDGNPPQSTGVTSTTTAAAAAAKKKPPPPPPKKKPGLAAAAAASSTASAPPDDDGPPPIPMSTRPNF